MNRKIREIMSARENGESGFTLIELLVVIIIIGILASIAIPIFMNQQKTARDSATTSDVKNVATNIQSALVRFPDADHFSITAWDAAAPGTEGATVSGTEGKVKVWVGNSTADNGDTAHATQVESYVVSLSKGTVLSVTGQDGVFVVKAANPNGKSYTAIDNSPTATAATDKSLAYDSAAGGIKN